MMVLRVLSAQAGGKKALDIAGLLKIKGSEIQQRYTELLMLAGWYHAIAFVCNAAGVPLEAWQARLPHRL